MNTRIWHRYVIGWEIDNEKWPLGWKTNIPVKDRSLPERSLMHTLYDRVEMFRRQDGQMIVVKIFIQSGSYTPVQTRDITERIRKIKHAETVTNDGAYFSFVFNYTKVWPRLNFFLAAIRLMEMIFTTLGVEDGDKAKLANFTVFKELVMESNKDGGWEMADERYVPKTWADETAKIKKQAGLTEAGIPAEKIGAFANSLSIIPPNPLEELKKKGI